MTVEIASPAPSSGDAPSAPSGSFAARYPLLYGLATNPGPKVLWIASIVALLLYGATFAQTVLASKDFVISDIAVVGGDFTTFWIAAKTLLADGPLALYQPDTLNTRLEAAFPLGRDVMLFWQYPPTFYFIVAPLAFLTYPAALCGWMAVTTSAAGGALASLWRSRTPLLVAFASAAAWQAWITGQTGFLTAALVTLAAGWADRRPVIAGIAAGLLTVKPQLGLLIPVAYAAAGCWRAFGAAAVTAILLAGLSVVFFGVESWVGFFEAMGAQGARLSLSSFPQYKLITPYGFLTTLGTPAALAIFIQGLAALALAAFVFGVWRKSLSWETRLIALAAATPLAAPYVFYYEAPIFFAAMIMLAKCGIERGWLRFEKQGLMALWILPAFTPGPDWLPISTLIAFAAFGLCARRVLHDCPLDLRDFSFSTKNKELVA